MVVNVPRIVESIANDPRDMVRVQLKPNDVRSYTRLEAEKLIATGTVPGAFIVGDPTTEPTSAEETRLSGEGSSFEEAAEDLKGKAAARSGGKAKAQRSAPNKARTTTEPKPADSPSTPAGPPVETKATEPPADPATSTPPAESQAE